MQILREAEENLVNNRKHEISISIHSRMSAYILNNKKQNIFDIENRHKVKITFHIDNNLSISEYIIDNNQIGYDIELKEENQHKEKISKKEKVIKNLKIIKIT